MCQVQSQVACEQSNATRKIALKANGKHVNVFSVR
jgi:hypothetical protein